MTGDVTMLARADDLPSAGASGPAWRQSCADRATRMSPVFRHGGLRLYLLKLLDEAPRHGYEVIRLLQDRFLGVYSPSPGTIYPRLARLEEEGLVTHDEVDGKKVYRITDKGREEINRASTTWPSSRRRSPSRCATSPAR